MKEKIPKSEIHKSTFLCLSSRIMTMLNIGMLYVLHLITKQIGNHKLCVSLLGGLELGLKMKCSQNVVTTFPVMAELYFNG